MPSEDDALLEKLRFFKSNAQTIAGYFNVMDDSGNIIEKDLYIDPQSHKNFPSGVGGVVLTYRWLR